MRFHILGLGPIGSLLSHHLRRTLPQIHPITLIHKNEGQANAARANGCAIRVEINGIVTSTDGFVSEAFNAPTVIRRNSQDSQQTIGTGQDKIESLFITTKAHQTVPAIRRLLPRLSPNSTIVLLQNGMGVYEELTHDIFRNPDQRPHFILASNTHGAFRKDTYDIVHAGVGEIRFGIVPDPSGRDFEVGFEDQAVPRGERAPRLSDISDTAQDLSHEKYKSLRGTVAAMLLLEGLNVSWKPMSDVETTMRQKLVVNAVINPLTALMGCRNGDIFRTGASRRIAQRVCQEASYVFEAQLKADTKLWFDSLASAGMDTQGVPVKRLPRKLTKSALEEEVFRVAQMTRGNVSSMLADIRTGRSTEVDFINGYLLKLGNTYRVQMPATAMLLNLVKMRSSIPLDQIL